MVQAKSGSWGKTGFVPVAAREREAEAETGVMIGCLECGGWGAECKRSEAYYELGCYLCWKELMNGEKVQRTKGEMWVHEKCAERYL